MFLLKRDVCFEKDLDCVYTMVDKKQEIYSNDVGGVFSKAFMYRRIKAGYRATSVACGWAKAVFEVPRSFGQG